MDTVEAQELPLLSKEPLHDTICHDNTQFHGFMILANVRFLLSRLKDNKHIFNTVDKALVHRAALVKARYTIP